MHSNCISAFPLPVVGDIWHKTERARQPDTWKTDLSWNMKYYDRKTDHNNFYRFVFGTPDAIFTQTDWTRSSLTQVCPHRAYIFEKSSANITIAQFLHTANDCIVAPTDYGLAFVRMWCAYAYSQGRSGCKFAQENSETEGKGNRPWPPIILFRCFRRARRRDSADKWHQYLLTTGTEPTQCTIAVDAVKS